MTALLIRNEREGKAWQVWPDPEPLSPGAIQETGNYLFELKGNPEVEAAELFIDDVRLEALRTTDPGVARWRWSPGFHSGIVEAELRLPGSSPRRFEVITDPNLRKLTRSDFDTMVLEILEDTFALFSLSSFRKGIAHGAVRRPPAIARLEFLRSRIDELEEVVAGIVRNPRRILTAEDSAVPYHRATRATGPEILRSFRSGRILTETNTSSRSRLPPALRGFLPEKVRVRRRLSSLDLPEHRQMAACLRAWASWLTTAAELLTRQTAERDSDSQRTLVTWAARCRRLSRRIYQLSCAEPFKEAGDSPPHLLLSAVFRNHPAYRRFFRLWQEMNYGLASVFGDFLNMPLARTFELYELWCFLRLVRAGYEEYGPNELDIRDLFLTDGAGGVTLATGAVIVSVGNGWKLCFQKQYREFWIEPDRQGSFSRTMTPDIVVGREPIAIGEPPRLIILDAKYRIDEGLNAALSSIHTYRDALVREAESGNIEGIVTSAYLLTPYVPVLGSGYRDTPLPGRLFHPQYRTDFRFGAVTLRPGMAVTEIGTALQTIVADASAPDPAGEAG